MEDMEPKAMELDEDLHSRQLAVYGRDTMKKMAGATVLISGMRGLGVEIAKNLVLAGVSTQTRTNALSLSFLLRRRDRRSRVARPSPRPRRVRANDRNLLSRSSLVCATPR